MIKTIKTYGAVLITPCADYLIVDIVDIDGVGRGLYAIVTDMETFGKDESEVLFHTTPFSVIVNGDWTIEFRNDTPQEIYLWIDAEKEVKNPYEDVMTKEEWQRVFDQESSVTDEDTNSDNV